MESFYEGRSVFITGGSGFLGKVVIEKIIRSLPKVNRIFVLIRTKRGVNSEDRKEKDIIQSQVWTRLRREQPGIDTRLREKIIAVPGDILTDGLGISDEWLQRLRDEVSIVLHCAAAVTFNERLDRAIAHNAHAAVRVLELSRSLPKLVAHIHVSTAYVNADKTHMKDVEEKLYPLGFDPHEVLAKYESWPAASVDREQMSLIGTHPNTYTLTKAMAEKLVWDLRGDLPVAIVRPSIIGVSYSEPVPGWVDTVSAATAVFLFCGLGILTFLPGNKRNIADVVPVDHVSNKILVAAHMVAQRDPRSPMLVMHAGTSHSPTPLHWRVCIKNVAEWFQKRPLKAAISYPRFSMYSSHQVFQLQWLFRYWLPQSAYNTYANAIGSDKQRKQANNLKKVTARAAALTDTFKHFTTYEWVFEADDIEKFLSPAEAACFNTRVEEIHWERYMELNGFGIAKYIMKEDVVDFDSDLLRHTDLSLTTDRLLEWDADHHSISFPGLLSDISWAYTSSRRPGYTKSGLFGRLMGLTGWREGSRLEAEFVDRSAAPTPASVRSAVLCDPRVMQVIRDEADTRGVTEAEILDEAKKTLLVIEARQNDSSPRSLAWALRKFMRSVYEGLHVDEAGISKLRKIAAANDGPILLLPTHRSYMDFLMLSYVCFAYNLPLPFIAAGEDFLNMSFVTKMLRESGAFFLRRSFKEDILYGVLFRAYLQQLVCAGQCVEFFIEGTRSRSGKTLPSKYGLLDMALEPVIDGRVSQLHVVPVSLDYERPLEAALYSDEVLGQSKMRENVRNLFKASSVMGTNFGHISMSFGEPISLKEALPDLVKTLGLAPDFIRDGSHLTPRLVKSPEILASQRKLVQHLASEIVDRQHSASVAMPTHLVSTLLLMHRQGMTHDSLIKQTDWLRRAVTDRGGRIVGVEGERRDSIVDHALMLLGELIKKRPRRDLQEPDADAREHYWRLVALGMYRNKLLHHFVPEALWAASMFSITAANKKAATPVLRAHAGGDFETKGVDEADIPALHAAAPEHDHTDTVSLEELRNGARFLDSLLRREFVRHMPHGAAEDLERGLDQALRLGTFKLVDGDSVMGGGGGGSGPSGGDERLQDGTTSSNTVVAVPDGGVEMFSLLCSMVWPFVDSYYVAILSLAALPGISASGRAKDVDKDGVERGGWVERKSLLKRAQWLAETLYHHRMISFYESCSMETLGNAISLLADWKVITTATVPQPTDKGAMQNSPCVALRAPYMERSSLGRLLSRINQFRRPPPVSMGSDPFSSVLAAELPVLAKL